MIAQPKKKKKAKKLTVTKVQAAVNYAIRKRDGEKCGLYLPKRKDEDSEEKQEELF